MRRTEKYEKGNAYILLNDDYASQIAEEVVKGFMNQQEENKSFIFVFFHKEEGIVLMHFKSIENNTDFDTAIAAIKNDLLNSDISVNDKELKKALKDPNASTSKILLDFLNSEK